MVSKKEQIAKLEAKLKVSETWAEHQERMRGLAERDNRVHREREQARMRRDHAEQQRARQEAEREDKRKRRQELSDGMLRLKDASEWAIVRDERGTVLELTVPLTADVEPIVHGVLTKNSDAPRPSSRPGVSIHSDYAIRLQEACGIRANAQRARDCHTF